MSRYVTKKLLLYILIVLAGVLIFVNIDSSQTLASPPLFELKAPAFIEAQETSPNAISSVLDRDAGISAYFQTLNPISLSQVRPLFRTISIQTSDYILGTMPVPDNSEQYDVHVYINRDGWMLAYYLRDMPAVGIFDWETYDRTMNPTRIQSVLNYVSTSLNLPAPTLTYYDFRYPNATNLLLAVEHVDSGQTDSFELLENQFVYHEASWGLGGRLYHFQGSNAVFTLDGTEIHSTDNTDRFDIGSLAPEQLPSINPHTITISYSGANFVMGTLAIIYEAE
jgi:hypothetical protein